MDSSEKALVSLDGLSVGDGFGETFFETPLSMIQDHRLPSAPWRWTDDTHMAISVVQTLFRHGRIDQDTLADLFAERFLRDSDRGYGGGAIRLLFEISRGGDWRDLSPKLFGGGSYGNGAAMRVAPLGGYYAGDPSRAADEAAASAQVTHSHSEGIAGAIAVAVAAALVADERVEPGDSLLHKTLVYIPQSTVAERIQTLIEKEPATAIDAAKLVGSGGRISAQDTVPFCLWCAGVHLDDFESALWSAVSAGGDMDTTCAIIGGIVALSSPPSEEWVSRREPLPPLR